MRTTIWLLSFLIGFLAAIECPAASAFQDSQAQVPQLPRTGGSLPASRSRTFNVLEFGAVGDDATDNTTAFSRCLQAIIEAGGGRM